MTNALRISPCAVAVVAAVCLGPGVARVHAAGEQAEQFTPEYRQTHTTYDAKHSPKITAPDSVKRGEWFNVTISVGAGGQHPVAVRAFHSLYRALQGRRWRSSAHTSTLSTPRRP